MRPLEVNEKELVLCPMRQDAQDDEDKFVTVDWCEGCRNFGGALRGGGGSQGTAAIGGAPTRINCNA